MGKVMTPVSFWRRSMKVKEVLSASRVDWMNLKSLGKFAQNKYQLWRVDNGTYYAKFNNGDFLEFR